MASRATSPTASQRPRPQAAERPEARGRGAAAVLVHIVQAGNPFAPDPDGIVSVQRNFIRAAPADLRFVYWGVRRPGVPERDLGPRARFRPVVGTSIQRPVVPLSLTFAAGLVPVRRRIREGILRFDRVESAVPFLGTRLPTVLFLHTWDVVDVRNPAAESRWRRAPGLYATLFDRVVRRMDRIYVLRPDMAEWLATRLPDGDRRLRPFSVPVDLERFRPLSLAERAAERARVLESVGVLGPAALVVFAGRLEGQKNPLALPEVAAVLGESDVPVHVLVAGTGSLEGAVADAAARLAPGRVHLLGSVDQDRLAGLLGAADALLLPSAFEGLPNVVLESLASGTPVVAARSAGRTAEILEGTGAGVIGQDDPRSLAAGIREVLSWPADRAGVCRALAHGFAAPCVNEPLYRELRALAGVRATG